MCNECDWEELKDKIEKMKDSGKFDWATDTLEGIHGTIEKNEHASDRQTQAITNIADSRPGWDD